MPKKQLIRSVYCKIEEDITASLAASVMIRETTKAKEEGWQEITLKVQTLPDRFTVAVYGIKK